MPVEDNKKRRMREEQKWIMKFQDTEIRKLVGCLSKNATAIML